eukprot:TRINITY_DN2208_c5_g1_i1.p1 TRINITY_DN2208_c5_g1~~TRINITY_DN2208_c5_g1_i1.p1  ORF type:complete len:644 (+),score=95.71 TRINITY_DN2208_c5_g1_i1:33-1964(+)
MNSGEEHRVLESMQSMDTTATHHPDEEEDFMSDWPQLRYEDKQDRLLLLGGVFGFFFGPFIALPAILCVSGNQAIKKKRKPFDVFVMIYVCYFLSAMFVAYLNTFYVTLAHRDGEAVYNSKTDRYGPITVYCVLYLWFFSVVAGHLKALSTDGYNPYPVKLHRLQELNFSPPLIGVPGESEITNVHTLVRRLCLYSEIWTAPQTESQCGSQTGSDETRLSDVLLRYDSDEDSDSPTDSNFKELASDNINWYLLLLLSAVIATVLTILLKVFFSQDPPSTSHGHIAPAVYWLSTLFWWLTVALVSTVVSALLTLYYKQLVTLIQFSNMTDVFAPKQTVPVIDMQSARNLLLWHEARTYLIDEITRPTSFLRAVFDPTCAIMCFVGSLSTIVILVKHIFGGQDIEEFSVLVIGCWLTSFVFFWVVITITRFTQRNLQQHTTLIVKARLQVANKLLLIEEQYSEDMSLRYSVEEVRKAENVVLQLLGPQFGVENMKKDPLLWREACIHLNRLHAKKEEHLSELEACLTCLEAVCFSGTISGSSWEGIGDCMPSMMGMGYMLPPCGPPLFVRRTTTARQSRISSFEKENKDRAEVYRRMRIIEAMLIQVSHRYVRPKVLGMELSSLLYVGMSMLIIFSTVLMAYHTT